MTRNSIIFVLASLGILIGWQFVTEHYFSPKPSAVSAGTAGEPAQATTTATTAAAPISNAQPVPKPAQGAARASLKEAPERLVQVETAAFSASVSSWGARVVSLKLKGVKNKDKDTEQDMDLVPTADGPLYGAVELPGVDLARLAWTPQSLKPVQEGAFQVLRFFVRVPGTALEITKAYRFEAEGKVFHVDLLVRNLGSQTLSLGPLAFCWGPNIGGDTALMGQFPPAGVVQLEGKIEREKANDDTQVLGYAAPKWVALKDHYFVVGYFPEGAGWSKAEIRRLGQGKVVTALVAEGLTLAPAATQALSLKAYAGPQDFDALKTVGFNFQRVVQFQFYQIFDWLNPLSVGLLHVLKWFHKITGNWGIGIILLTLLVRGLMFWPSLKSMVSMRRMQTKMAAMQPRLATLKKVYKDDPNKLNQEMMKLYKEYGVNPLGGCLPMLLQIPIFFALYGTLSAAFELRGAPFFWKWEDLTAGDPTYMFPIAMGVTMFLQQKLAPTSATMSDEQAQMQKMMLWMMPIMFTGMALFMHWPVGLLLYWTASNIFGILQQLAVNKAVD